MISNPTQSMPSLVRPWCRYGTRTHTRAASTILSRVREGKEFVLSGHIGKASKIYVIVEFRLAGRRSVVAAGIDRQFVADLHREGHREVKLYGAARVGPVLDLHGQADIVASVPVQDPII